MIIPKFHGMSVIHWIGVVEDRDDSTASDGLKLGRVRVRVLGFHSETKKEDDEMGEGIPTNKLHWAYPICPITSASVSGVGQSPTGLVEGTWVMGISMDGAAMQDLYILGTLPGCPKKRLNPENQGFTDPYDTYPLDDYLKESDVNRLARAESIEKTYITRRNSLREKGVVTGDGSSWNEPLAAYAAEYPFNHVKESESGHIHEVDDTPGAERLHTRHRTGTFTEIDQDGNEVHKIVGSNFEIVVQDKNAYIKGNLNITVVGNANIKVEDANIDVGGDANVDVDGNITMDANGNITISAKGILSLSGLLGASLTSPLLTTVIGGDAIMTMDASGNITISAPGLLSLTGLLGASLTSLLLTVVNSGDGNITMDGAGNITISAPGLLSLSGLLGASLTSPLLTTVIGVENQGIGFAKGVI